MRARNDGSPTARVSLDLGLTISDVLLHTEGALLPDGQTLSWSVVEHVAHGETSCFAIEQNEARKITVFSEATGRAYSLMATPRAPTFVNGGFTMHRIVGIDPYEDTQRKIRAVAPVRGRVLDTVTGLGYTAIEAAKTANEVVTVELDPLVLTLARLNPWSRQLFAAPNIHQIIGDTFDVIQTFDDQSFALAIHDPPTLSLAGDLYSGDYYRQLFRVLQRGGRLFHYIGNLESQHGARVSAGVIRRLKDAGFARVLRRNEAFGVVAQKA